jgi:hypothetical protein
MPNRILILTTILSLLAFTAGAQTPPPQRTMVSRPESAAPADTSGASPSSAVTVALEKYREMWNRMSAPQRQAFVNAGGSTPEQYERILKQRGNSFAPAGDGALQSSGERSRKAAPDSGNPIDSNAFDSLSKSLQDLSAVRDGNLWRVQKDGCPPEIASRMADLRGKLETDEFELKDGESTPAVPGAGSKDKTGSADRLAIAADWFKHSADTDASTAAAAPRATDVSSRESKLLEAALAGNRSAAAPASPVDPRSPEGERTRKAAEEDIARIKAELAQLSGACTAPKK